MQRIAGWRRWLLPLAALVTFAGYVGPWVGHAAAGLVVSGLDLGEIVKFLPSTVNGGAEIWRSGFYAPLVAVSLLLSLYAFDPRLHYHWALRGLLLSCAAVAALNMLPPAWTPQRMTTPEFRAQSSAIALCLAAVLGSPFLALLPGRVRGAVIALCAGAALWWPVRGFLLMLPDLSLVYNHSVRPGWGFYLLSVGCLTMIAGAITEFTERADEVGYPH